DHRPVPVPAGRTGAAAARTVPARPLAPRGERDRRRMAHPVRRGGSRPPLRAARPLAARPPAAARGRQQRRRDLVRALRRQRSAAARGQPGRARRTAAGLPERRCRGRDRRAARGTLARRPVIAGLLAGHWPVVLAGGSLVAGAVTAHAAWLVRLLRRALPGRF